MAGKHRHSLAGAPSVTDDVRARFRERRDILLELAQFIADRYRHETDEDARAEWKAHLQEVHQQVKALEANFVGDFAPRYAATNTAQRGGGGKGIHGPAKGFKRVLSKVVGTHPGGNVRLNILSPSGEVKESRELGYHAPGKIRYNVDAPNGQRVSVSMKKQKTKAAAAPVRIGPLKRGSLTDYGYWSGAPVAERHEALQDAVSAIGQLHVVHKLNAVAVLNKNRNPALSQVFRSDQQWVSSGGSDKGGGGRRNHGADLAEVKEATRQLYGARGSPHHRRAEGAWEAREAKVRKHLASKT